MGSIKMKVSEKKYLFTFPIVVKKSLKMPKG